MVLNNKHFDDMDDFGDFEEKLEPSEDIESSEPAPNAALSWRRILIERAATNVRKALENKAEVNTIHKLGSLVFDNEARKFGRVIESRPGFLNISLLSGGRLVKQDLSQLDFIRQHRQKLTLPEMATKLSLSELEVIALLNKIELETEQSLLSPTMPKAKVELKKTTPKKPLVKARLTGSKLASPAKNNNQAKMKIAAKTNQKSKAFVNKDLSFARLLPKGSTTDPIRDPNGYIQQNFLLMSNRELASATGLSEHTVRRKLGEWSLKRKDFVNKA